MTGMKMVGTAMTKLRLRMRLRRGASEDNVSWLFVLNS
jgi:hypothetical protein